MIRMLIVGYCYGIRSEHKLCQEVELHFADLWFCKLDLEDKVPHHSTCSENRLGRFRESGLLRRIFERVVWAAMAIGQIPRLGGAWRSTTKSKRRARTSTISPPQASLASMTTRSAPLASTMRASPARPVAGRRANVQQHVSAANPWTLHPGKGKFIWLMVDPLAMVSRVSRRSLVPPTCPATSSPRLFLRVRCCIHRLLGLRHKDIASALIVVRHASDGRHV
jgi:hypothetical protein